MSEIHKMAGHLIRRLNQISAAIFRDRMAAAGLDLTPVQFAALATVADEPGIDQATLAGAIAYDKVTIGGVVDRLVAKGLMTRHASQRDRRAKVLALSAAGQDMLVAARPIVWALQADILSGLSAQERETFLSLLARATGGAS